MAKDMDLLMRIRAQGSQALAELKRVKGAVESVAGGAKSLGHAGAWGVGMLGKSAGFLFAPLKMAAGLSLAASIAVGGMGYKALGASGDIETLRLRLEGVTASQEDANRIFRETMQLSIKSPFDPQELIEARIALINIGQTGEAAITAVGDAAAISQKPMRDLVSALAGMESEPLRRIGVQLKTEAGKYEFTFRDKMQNVRKIAANGIDEARKSLLSIFDVKYGGGMTKFASAWQGITSTLRGNIALGLGDIGNGLMPAAKSFAGAINDRLADAMEKGTLAKWGEKAGEGIQYAFEYASEVAARIRDDWDALSSGGPGKFAEAFRIAANAGAEMFATGLVTYLTAAGDVFTGLGKLIAGGFVEQYLGSDLPGAEALRKNMMGFSAVEIATGRKTSFEGLTPEAQTALAMKRGGIDRGQLFSAGLSKFTEALPDLGSKLMDKWAGIIGKAETGIGALTGTEERTPIDYLIAQRQMQTVQNAGTMPEWAQFGAPKDRVTVAMQRRRRTSTGAETYTQESARTVPAGTYREGQTLPSGATVIHVENLTVKANDAQQMRENIRGAAGVPALAAATSG